MLPARHNEGNSLPLGGIDTEAAIALVIDKLRAEGSCGTIDKHDLTAFRQNFANVGDGAFYGNSFIYVTQACRGLGFGITYRKGGIMLPLGVNNAHFVVVRPLGLLDEVFVEMLDHLVAISRRPVFLKKVSKQQQEALRVFKDFQVASSYDATRREVKPGAYTWATEAYADDDTYPELILDLDITLSNALLLRDWEPIYREAHSLPPCMERIRSVRRSYKQYRRRIRQFERTGVDVLLETYRSDQSDEVVEFIARYFGGGKRNNVDAYGNMLKLLDLYGANEGLYAYVAYLQKKDTPIGFYVAERLDQDSAGLYSGLCERTVPGLPEYVRMKVFRQLRNHGIKYLNLGGAEGQTLHRYKHHFAPIRERQMPMMVYGLGKCE